MDGRDRIVVRARARRGSGMRARKARRIRDAIMVDRSPACAKIAGEDSSSETAAAVHAKIIGPPMCGVVIYIYIRRGAAIYPACFAVARRASTEVERRPLSCCDLAGCPASSGAALASWPPPPPPKTRKKREQASGEA
ncbi:hypothetical protein MTO96_000052 [Rhipicephalus appendiculatus]